MSAATLTATPEQTPRQNQRPKQNREAIFLFLPALLPVLLLSVYPLIRGIALGFTDARAGLNVDTNFIGFGNFEKLLHNGLFWDSFKIGLIWTLSVTILQFVAALGLALLLNTNLRFRGVARTLALIPWAMPPVVVAIMWRLLLHPTNGPVNEILQRLHLTDHPINFLGDFSTALPHGDRGRYLGRHADDHGHPAGRTPGHRPIPVRGGRGGRQPARGASSGTSRCRS